jgi:hypothetical protein
MPVSPSVSSAAPRCRQTGNLANGAYGLQVRSAPFAVPGLTEPAQGWSDLHIHVELSDGEEPEGHALDDARATILIAPGMRAEVDRASRTATLVTREPWPPGAIAHPFLAGPGMAFAWWERRETLHGGVFVAGDGAWALLADKGGGKSTLLGALARAGAPVVADDLVVVDDGRVMAGPRGIDLSPQAAETIGAHDASPEARFTKLRLSLGPIAPETPLRGFVHLAWGDDVELARVPVAERAARIARHRSILSLDPTTPGGILDLLRLPSYELRRPRDLALLPRAVELLLALRG